MADHSKAKDLHRDQYAGVDFSRHSKMADEGLREHETPLVLKYLPDKSGTLLEIGCGCGRIAFGLEKGGYGSITATDFVPEFIAEAERIASARCSRVTFNVADVMSLPFQGAEYEYIVCLGVVLSHLPYSQQHEDALKEIFRVMRPGGTALISVKNMDWDSWHMLPLRLTARVARSLYNPFEYTRNVLPRIGSGGRLDWKFLSAGKPQLYYFGSRELAELVRSVGFVDVDVFDERAVHGRAKRAGCGGHTLFPPVPIIRETTSSLRLV